MKITNISQGPRGIHTVDGLRIIPAGDTIDVELEAVELEGAEATGWFGISGKAIKEDDGLDRDELKKQAAELGIDFARNASNEKIKELIDAKLAS
jgi:hypothetical protein